MGAQVSRVRPGYTVDSKTTTAPGCKAGPMRRQALSSGARSGRGSGSIGVGTVTMKNLAAARSLGSFANFSFEPLRSAGVTSPVQSSPRRSAAMRGSEMSKPMTGSKFRAKARATGKPTYPSPTTAYPRSFNSRPLGLRDEPVALSPEYTVDDKQEVRIGVVAHRRG